MYFCLLVVWLSTRFSLRNVWIYFMRFSSNIGQLIRSSVVGTSMRHFTEMTDCVETCYFTVSFLNMVSRWKPVTQLNILFFHSPNNNSSQIDLFFVLPLMSDLVYQVEIPEVHHLHQSDITHIEIYLEVASNLVFPEGAPVQTVEYLSQNKMEQA